MCLYVVYSLIIIDKLVLGTLNKHFYRDWAIVVKTLVYAYIRLDFTTNKL